MATTNTAIYEGVNPKSFIAGSTISKYRAVVLASDGEVDHVGTANTIAPTGISMGDAAAGAPVDVACDFGAIVKIEAGAAVTKGQEVSSDNVGRAIDRTSTTNNVVIGRALEAATAAGQIIPIQYYVRTLAP